MTRARVIAPHRAPDRPPIRIAPGDVVTLGARDEEWPAFAWTTHANGLGGWVPASLFDREQGTATAKVAYDTRELDVDAGERLTLHRELADWWWAENSGGATGWIPARAFERIEED